MAAFVCVLVHEGDNCHMASLDGTVFLSSVADLSPYLISLAFPSPPLVLPLLSLRSAVDLSMCPQEPRLFRTPLNKSFISRTHTHTLTRPFASTQREAEIGRFGKPLSSCGEFPLQEPFLSCLIYLVYLRPPCSY